MALTELARLSISPSLCPAALPQSFFCTWRKALAACSRASSTTFQLWQDERDPTSLFMLGGWQTPEAHAKFLRSKEAMELAKGIGQWVGIEKVQHLDLDVSSLHLSACKKRLIQIDTFDGIDESLTPEWEAHWLKNSETALLPSGAARPSGDFVGGWDVSGEVQAHENKQAFRDVRDAVGVSGSRAQTPSPTRAERKTWVAFSIERDDAKAKKVVDGSPSVLDDAEIPLAQPVPSKSVKVRLML